MSEQKAAKQRERRAARRALEAQRPWLKFYDARTPYQIRPPTASLPKLFEATARRFGKFAALEYFGRRMTWSEVDRLATRFANGLIAGGLKPRERVMLALANSPQWLIAYFGILKAGAVAVLCEADSSTETLAGRIVETQAVILIADSRQKQYLIADDILHAAPELRLIVLTSLAEYMGMREKLKRFLLRPQDVGARIVRSAGKKKTADHRFARFSRVLARGSRLPLETPSEVENVAAIVYTFGTGGAALPVPLSHRNLAANALQLRHWLPESRPGDERFLAQQSFSSAYGLTGLVHLGVYLGATLILLPDYDIARLLKAVKKLRPTYFPTTPRVVRLLTHTPGVRRFGFSSIRVCAVSGSSLPQEIREEFEKITRGRLIEAYGLTEASPAAIAMPVAVRRQAGAVGIPLPDTDVKILDLQNGKPCAFDIPGELWVRGPQVFAGYMGIDNQYAAATQTRLIDGWLATGDIARLNEDGFVTIIDRKDNVFVRQGRAIYPRQIEEILFEHPAVAIAQVGRASGAGRGETLKAKVVLHRNMNATEQELIQYCAKHLPPDTLPDSIAVEKQEAIDFSS